MRADGYDTEPILRVLDQQGLRITARTYRGWNSPDRHRRPARRQGVLWPGRESGHQVVDEDTEGSLWAQEVGRSMAPSSRPGRHLRCNSRRDSQPRSRKYPLVEEAARHHPRAEGRLAGGPLNHNFSTAAPDCVWVADFTYVRTGAGVCPCHVRERVRPAHWGLARRPEHGHRSRDDSASHTAAAVRSRKTPPLSRCSDQPCIESTFAIRHLRPARATRL